MSSHDSAVAENNSTVPESFLSLASFKNRTHNDHVILGRKFLQKNSTRASLPVFSKLNPRHLFSCAEEEGCIPEFLETENIHTTEVSSMNNFSSPVVDCLELLMYWSSCGGFD